jgi:hypothetical protein
MSFQRQIRTSKANQFGQGMYFLAPVGQRWAHQKRSFCQDIEWLLCARGRHKSKSGTGLCILFACGAEVGTKGWISLAKGFYFSVLLGRIGRLEWVVLQGILFLLFLRGRGGHQERNSSSGRSVSFELEGQRWANQFYRPLNFFCNPEEGTNS